MDDIFKKLLIAGGVFNNLQTCQKGLRKQGVQAALAECEITHQKPAEDTLSPTPRICYHNREAGSLHMESVPFILRQNCDLFIPNM